ncbi:MAG: chorismate mutase [Candidatus Nanoarchaeia archaeon]|nr:chorismate mutase [Candidatus Nanoarchaeia archaeon]MDD5740618.1 chorismate mutase [Candidatus Nanoarchaeia archaeon]
MENKKIAQLRMKIDNIDESLMSLLDKRADIVKVIGKIKEKQGLPVFNKSRENEILLKSQRSGNTQFVNSVFIKILGESRRIQEERWR